MALDCSRSSSSPSRSHWRLREGGREEGREGRKRVRGKKGERERKEERREGEMVRRWKGGSDRGREEEWKVFKYALCT